MSFLREVPLRDAQAEDGRLRQAACAALARFVSSATTARSSSMILGSLTSPAASRSLRVTGIEWRATSAPCALNTRSSASRTCAPRQR